MHCRNSDLATALREAGMPGTAAPRRRRRASQPRPEASAERKPRRYRESDFQREFNRFCQPYRDRKTKELLYAGPGWVYVRIPDQPWAEGATRTMQRKPFDCCFTARRQHPLGGYIAEQHCCELKVCRDETLRFSQVQPHQWEALRLAEAQGGNAFGWVIASFFPQFWPAQFERQEVYAARVSWLDFARRCGETGVSVGWLRRRAIRLHAVDVHPWKSDRRARRGWDATPLINAKQPE